MKLKHVAVALGIAGLVSMAVPAEATGGGRVRELLTGLSSPKGLAVTGRGDFVVAQGAFGPPGPVIVYPVRGPQRGQPIELTGPLSLVDVAVSPADRTIWALGTDFTLYHRLADGTIQSVANIADYQATDHDPVDQDGIPEESNPYGLTVMPNGDALVADAAGNDVIKVTAGGDVSTVARFDLESVPTDHLPPGAFPPALTAESVPTTVTIGPDGAIYVGELKGFPFRPGSSNIWRIEPGADGAWCSASGSTGGCSLYDTGYTAIQDITFHPHDGAVLLVYELAKGGVLEFEEGLDTGVFPDAVLLYVGSRGTWEMGKGKLSQPGGVVVGRQGRIFVTDGVFTDGRLVEVT